jgi:CheY-like chemotaxis protein
VPRGHPAETILVVEDDPDVRGTTTGLVANLGYRVLSASDGAEAIRLLEAHPDVRLLFTDVALPGMNGRQLADRARQRQPNLKVLFTTGYARNAIVHQGRLDEGVDVLFKPFSRADLAARLRRILDSD